MSWSVFYQLASGFWVFCNTNVIFLWHQSKFWVRKDTPTPQKLPALWFLQHLLPCKLDRTRDTSHLPAEQTPSLTASVERSLSPPLGWAIQISCMTFEHLRESKRKITNSNALLYLVCSEETWHSVSRKSHGVDKDLWPHIFFLLVDQ